MKKLLIFVLLGLTFSACTSVSGNSVSLTNGYRFSLGKGSSKFKIFLVAGTFWSPSHAKELAAQKKIWLDKGYAEEEIACYYFPPTEEKKKEFEVYFNTLINCYLADPDYLLSHIKEAAESNPESVYVYISSTGRKPMVDSTYKFKSNEDKKEMDRILALKKWSEPYTMEMMGHIRGRLYSAYTSIDKARVFGFNAPESADQYLLTPRSLRAALESLPAKTKKTIVLQGCYTEGFILPAKTVGATNTLAGLQNISVIAAAPSDTQNEKCKDGYETASFGEAYDVSLRKYLEILPKNEKDLLSQINWKKIFTHAEAFSLERDVFINEKNPLYPKFYSN